MITILRKSWDILALAAIALHIGCNLFFITSDTFLNAWHLSIVLGLGYSGFAIAGNATNFRRIRDIALAVCGFAVGIYFLLFEDAVFERFELTLADQLVALAAVILVLDLTRRVTGWVIPVIALTLLAYVMYLGKYMPGLFYFGGLSEYRMAFRMFWQDGALLGSTTTISATIIFMFVLLSTLMRAAGATQFLISGALRLMRHVPGGSAHVAVLSSALMGTVSGSAVANVAGTGTITIPLMKRAGLSKEFAGGVEAAASTGSQLVPPIMGAGIFIMSDWIGVPYTELVLISIIPAILYFLSISVNIHLSLKRDGLLNAEQTLDELEPVRWTEGLAFLMPIILLVALLVVGYSPVYAAGWACGTVVVASFATRYPLWPTRWLAIAQEAVQTMIPTAIVLICAGIIVVCVETSGLVVAMAQSLAILGNGNTLLIIGIIAIISLFLGMGLPVTASYIIVASFGAPALISLGISPVAAHMAIFWLSQDSLLTPPVCLAAFAAAGIAGGNPAKTGVMAMVLGKGLYIVPLLFVFHGLLFDRGVEAAMVATVAGTAIIVFFAMSFTGMARDRLGVVARALLACAAGFVLWPMWQIQLAGAVLGAGAVGMNALHRRRLA
ncbi:TRAP transporter permease [Roseibium marinum]|uniref:TRAP transporter 4TM/12TM fusion protein n=1 Tax=Roseibium marinum TaxID=281252 RepID=A0A2S3UNH5_9HYPH|nr:TRAP transporter fused permease subunit [Roseibium marinum]POF29130.1 TRAP transporter 4TM/12TM fusion protein [Roseibium marinum]